MALFAVHCLEVVELRSKPAQACFEAQRLCKQARVKEVFTEQGTAKLKTRALSAKERRQNTVSKSVGGFLRQMMEMRGQNEASSRVFGRWGTSSCGHGNTP